MTATRRLRCVVAAVAVVGATLGACSGDTRLAPPITAATTSDAVSTVDTGATTTTTGAPGETLCETQDPTRSYGPPEALPTAGQMPAGSSMAAIQARGKLRVGVSGDTLLFGARNPITGQIEGFDIDVLNRIAAAIFGEPADGDSPNSQLDITVIPYSQRLPVLIDDKVDLVAHTMTINCARWQQIAFSTEYYAAGQKVIVKTSSTAKSITDLDDAAATVCAPDGSTNLDNVSDKATYPNLKLITRSDVTDCLAAVQQGLADAATGDDTVLAGFVAQDPNTKVIGDQFTSEPYGVGVNAGRRDLVEFVNGVLEEMRTDTGTDNSLTGLYNKWLVDKLDGPVPTPPAAEYFGS